MDNLHWQHLSWQSLIAKCHATLVDRACNWLNHAIIIQKGQKKTSLTAEVAYRWDLNKPEEDSRVKALAIGRADQP